MADIILLTSNNISAHNNAKIMRTLGAYRIASALEEQGYTVRVIDFIAYLSLEDILKSIDLYLTPQTLWVGYSSSFFTDYSNGDNPETRFNTNKNRMYPFDSQWATEISKHIRSKSKAKILFGGVNVFNDYSNIDYYFMGFGDNSIIEFTNALKENRLDGFKSYRFSTYDSYLSDTRFIRDHDFPEPDPKKIRTNWWNRHFKIQPGESVPIELARGCIFKCKFCTMPLMGKKKGTYLIDFDYLKDDLIRMYEENGITSYYIVDDTLNDDVDKLKDLHRIMTSLPFKPRFTSYLRLDLIDRFPETADILKEAGLVGCFFGIETLNHESGKAIGKGLHPDRTLARLHWLKDRWGDNVSTMAGMILGLPYDTPASIERTVNWVNEPDFPLSDLAFSVLRFPSKKEPNVSEFGSNPEKYGYTLNKGHWIHSSGMTSQDFDQIISDHLTNTRMKLKVGSFDVLNYTNIGIPLSDIQTKTRLEIHQEYNIPQLNQTFIDRYKKALLNDG